VKEFLLVPKYHASEESYVHVYLKMLKKTNIYSQNFLDLKDLSGKIFHGNYQSDRKPNNIIEYMLKDISSKVDPNLLYSTGMSYLIGELRNLKDFYESLIDLAKGGKVYETMEFLEQTNPEMYLKQGQKIEDRLLSIYRDKVLTAQSNYKLKDFYLIYELYKSRNEYIEKRKQGENPVLAIVSEARYR
jgi:hypothetical protein